MVAARISLLFLLLLATTANAQVTPPKRRKPVLAVNQIGDRSFSIALVNVSNVAMNVGELESILGSHQFQFDVEADGTSFVIERKDITISPDFRNPILIRPGGFHEFRINFDDDSWDYNFPGSERKEIDKTEWKKIKVKFRQGATLPVEKVKEFGLFSVSFESEWISVHQPWKRFLKEEFNQEINKKSDQDKKTRKDLNRK